MPTPTGDELTEAVNRLIYDFGVESSSELVRDTAADLLTGEVDDDHERMVVMMATLVAEWVRDNDDVAPTRAGHTMRMAMEAVPELAPDRRCFDGTCNEVLQQVDYCSPTCRMRHHERLRLTGRQQERESIRAQAQANGGVLPDEVEPSVYADVSGTSGRNFTFMALTNTTT